MPSYTNTKHPYKATTKETTTTTKLYAVPTNPKLMIMYHVKKSNPLTNKNIM